MHKKKQSEIEYMCLHFNAILVDRIKTVNWQQIGLAVQILPMAIISAMFHLKKTTLSISWGRPNNVLGHRSIMWGREVEGGGCCPALLICCPPHALGGVSRTRNRAAAEGQWEEEEAGGGCCLQQRQPPQLLRQQTR